MAHLSKRVLSVAIHEGRIDIYGGIAQLVERLLCKQDVSGSSPLTSTKTTVSIEIELASALPSKEIGLAH